MRKTTKNYAAKVHERAARMVLVCISRFTLAVIPATQA